MDFLNTFTIFAKYMRNIIAALVEFYNYHEEGYSPDTHSLLPKKELISRSLYYNLLNINSYLNKKYIFKTLIN